MSPNCPGMFQSLFSWMFRPKVLSQVTDAMFQSLFSWMFRPKSFFVCIVSFNPCSRGCFARRMTIFDPSRIDVSILVLVDVSLEAVMPSCEGRRAARVSILVLVDVSPEVPGPGSRDGDTLFQSLFSWMFRPKYQTHGIHPECIRVSILVLVDVSPEDRPILALFGCILIKMLEISCMKFFMQKY